MLKRFYPTEYVESVYTIDYNNLKKLGITGLIFDLDNTLAPFDIDHPTEEIKNFIKTRMEEGFKICLVSNNKGKRVEIFNEGLKLPFVSKAGKPKKNGILNGMSQLNLTSKEVVMIGDQMFTDVWVGNRLDMHTILVKPICERDEFTVKLKRGTEKIVFKQYLKYIEKQRN
ncbi:MAG: YqeG family HAD IIIA-type phosphatase [Lachnospirales bacterium]